MASNGCIKSAPQSTTKLHIKPSATPDEIQPKPPRPSEDANRNVLQSAARLTFSSYDEMSALELSKSHEPVIEKQGPEQLPQGPTDKSKEPVTNLDNTEVVDNTDGLHAETKPEVTHGSGETPKQSSAESSASKVPENERKIRNSHNHITTSKATGMPVVCESDASVQVTGDEMKPTVVSSTKKSGQTSRMSISEDVVDYVRGSHSGSSDKQSLGLTSRKSKSGLRRRISRLFSCGPKTGSSTEVQGANGRRSHRPETMVPEVKIDQIEDAFVHYNHYNKATAHLSHRRGLCVIFSLFTGELTGYIEDRKAAFHFFHSLRYEVFCDSTDFVNVTRSQLLYSIEQVKLFIEDKAQKTGGPYFDRFVFIILTHGEKGGLMTCANNDDVLEERLPVLQPDGSYRDQRVLTKVEEICDEFKHDKVPSMKGVPKLFLIQACRGSDILRAAGPGSSQTDGVQHIYDMSNLQLRPEVPIDADQIVYYATTSNHESWVSPTKGSWLIEKVLAVFTRHYKTKHLSEMLTTVNFAISNERGVTKQGDKVVEVCQMPCMVSTLRMAYFL